MAEMTFKTKTKKKIDYLTTINLLINLNNLIP